MAINGDEFIDCQLLSKLINDPSKMENLLIMDVRTLNKHSDNKIKHSIHLFCQDKITKKRLETKKLTVESLLNSESKNKLLKQFEAKNSKNILTIVLYDEISQSEIKPGEAIKVAFNNIVATVVNVDCKILKEGFKKFSELFPELCEKVKSSVTTSQSPREHFEEPNPNKEIMSKILDYLYLGNESNAGNKELLVKEGITHIINVSTNIPFFHEKSDDIKIEYMRVPIVDKPGENIKKYFDQTNAFIQKVKNQEHGKVLVHCQAGISRSPTIVVAYLMKVNKLTFNSATKMVLNIRSFIEPNFSFTNQLLDYEEEIKNK